VYDLCERAKITRQWLNKLVDLGKVPGCYRKPNGRLSIEECKELANWIRVTCALQEQKRGRRLSLQERLNRLENHPLPESYTAAELGRKIGLTSSTTRRQVHEVPGAYFDGIRYRFRNTPELAHWIKAGITARHLEKEKVRRQRLRFPSNDFLRAGGSINRAFVNIVRLLRYRPINSWDFDQLRFFRDDLGQFDKFASSIGDELKRRRERSRVAGTATKTGLRHRSDSASEDL